MIVFHPRRAGKSWWNAEWAAYTTGLFPTEEVYTDPVVPTLRFIMDEYYEPIVSLLDEDAGLHKNKVAVKQRLKQNPRTRKSARWS